MAPPVVHSKRNDDEDATEEFYTLVTHIDIAEQKNGVPSYPHQFHGLQTETAAEE